jgi:NAD+ synthase (glutamine-hydrolysing)
MKNYGFIRTAAAVPSIRLADPAYNADEICRLIDKAIEEEVSLIVFPELTLTGSTCGDLFTNSALLKGAEEGLDRIMGHMQKRYMEEDKGITAIIGLPKCSEGKLYNCAAVLGNGYLEGFIPKLNVAAPFTSGKDFPRTVFELNGTSFGVEIGDDTRSALPPSAELALAGAAIIANPSASAEVLYTDLYRKDLLRQHSSRTHTAYIHASAGLGESSTDHVFSGAAAIWENGECIAENERYQTESSMTIADVDFERLDVMRMKDSSFRACTSSKPGELVIIGSKVDPTDFEKKLYRPIEQHPFAPAKDLDYRCREILDIQTAGLARRLSHIGCQTAVIGISGGLDSTLALLVAVMAFDRLGWSRDRIIGVTMPGYGTTVRTKSNATELMDALGITSREISIVAACDQHFLDLGHDKNKHDVTFENSQARERTQIIMDIANQTNGLVIGTGDLSELALGWATYNGDHMSMYGVNAGVPKTLVRSLVKWATENRFESVKDILLDIVDTPISPELLPANDKGEIQQVTEDLVGPYELHDFFIYNFMRNGYSPEKILFLARKAFEGTYDEETIVKWLKTFVRRFFNQQFKRSCLPDGPAIGSVSLSPRGAWNMPSDAWSTFFSKLD